MAIRVRIPRPASGHHLRSRILLVLLAIVAAAAVTGVSIFGYFYHKYVGIVDERLKQPIFANTAQIYAAPREVRPGQKLSIRWIANELHDAGYTGDGATQPSQLGSYSEGVSKLRSSPARSPITRRITPRST
jgi:penicillin-binding protein 1B